jgi:hypothetical protein
VSCRTAQLYVSNFLSVRDTKPPRFSDHIAFDEFEGALEYQISATATATATPKGFKRPLACVWGVNTRFVCVQRPRSGWTAPIAVLNRAVSASLH